MSEEITKSAKQIPNTVHNNDTRNSSQVDLMAGANYYQNSSGGYFRGRRVSNRVKKNEMLAEPIQSNISTSQYLNKRKKVKKAITYIVTPANERNNVIEERDSDVELIAVEDDELVYEGNSNNEDMISGQ